MDRVTVYLRTALFSQPADDAHLPPGTSVLEGAVEDQPSGGLLLRVSRVRDARGRDLGEVDLLLFLPWAKVDHMHVHSV